MPEKHITMLQDLKQTPINDSCDLTVWKGKATNIIRRIYGSGSAQERQIEEIQFHDSPRMSFGGVTTGGGNNIESCKKKAYGLTDAFIDELKKLGLPKEVSTIATDKINITVTQSQTQEQTIKLKIILSALQDELTGKQLKELQDILETEPDNAKKKNKLIEKAKSFGGDVLANVIANLLTNPIFG